MTASRPLHQAFGAAAIVIALAACGSSSGSKAQGSTSTAHDMAAMNNMSHDLENQFGDALGGELGDKSTGEVKPLTKAEQTKLDTQLAATRAVAAKLPTAADAIAAGYEQQGTSTPGRGVRFVAASSSVPPNADGLMNGTDLEHPSALLYEGSSPASKIVGLEYSSTNPTPKGFAGPNDQWRAVPKGEGFNTGTYRVFVWSVPGFEVPDAKGGVFANSNPKLQ